MVGRTWIRTYSKKDPLYYGYKGHKVVTSHNHPHPEGTWHTEEKDLRSWENSEYNIYNLQLFFQLQDIVHDICSIACLASITYYI